eukprot:TRINITY_DN982_c0_g1_i3.p1 TRINITY_DN982_c0_g1~~TRINITY_DN982_c0_g1_i3.p1  ORF type:complete len:190 (-),score=45.83 TRINITY_DN982_c0_g1_i3:376-945(-)
MMQASQEPYALPDLEAAASKLGVVRQTVKDIVQELVSEDTISTDKIGVTVFYWSFPSDAATKKQRTLDQLTQNVQHLKEKLELLKKENEELTAGREESEERTGKLQQLKALREEKGKIEEQITQLSSTDPALMAAMEEDTKVSIEAINRWTDNIYSVRSWAVKKFSCNPKELDVQFGIPEEMDYFEQHQ